ncbi:MAG: tetratricopeptide repeat protein [candidate division KSB1 bacterium]|nr:tetratricopeptide repeat protein [candidate division KSB1 bacterium]MDZ7301071.1 tetratricopeptide repeat protein [candidate division KSB1 bacterium]MDZ7312105.1 tetratricopeptide repeat protein [candidate division KSB1 bacterium]
MKRILMVWVGLVMLLILADGVRAQSVEMNSAKLYKKQGEYDKAIEWFEKAIAKKPENAEAHYLLGDLYGMKGRIADMVHEFNASLSYSKKYEKDISLLLQRYFAEQFNNGVKAANEQNYPQALESFLNARLINPTQPDSYRNLAFVYTRMDSTDAVIRVYHELLAIKPDDYQSYLMLASIYNQRQQYDECIGALQKAAELAPDTARTRIIGEIGITYDMMGKSDEAMKTYEDALKLSPGNKDLLFNMGRLYLLREDYANAIKKFDEVLLTNPDDFEVNYNVGLSHLKIGERLDKKARDIEDEAMAKKKKPNTARIDSLRQVANESFKAAMPYLLKAVELNPEQPNAWHNLGVGYIRTGQLEKANEAFAKSEALQAGKQ